MKRLAPLALSLALPELPDVVDPRGRRPRLAFVVGFALVLLITFVRLQFPEALSAPDRPFLIYVSAVLAAAWLGGQLPALAVTVVSAIVAVYFFVEPVGLAALQGTIATRLLIFLLAGVFLSLVCEALHRGRERMEERTRELQHEMRARGAIEGELRRVNERKDQFLAILAHELRNPLTPIVNAAAMLHAQHSNDAMVRRAALMIDRHAHHLVRLVDDLLDVARIERGTFELRRSAVAIDDIVESAVEHCRSALQERGHRLDVRLPAARVVIDGDELRLVQLVANLLANAISYTPPGGAIQVEATASLEELRIVVRDTGIGIPPELTSRIFGLFERGAPITSGGAGLGIGLALVFQIAQLHGGRVAARSDGVGCGSEFTVVLPVAHVTTAIASRAPERAPTPPRHVRHTPLRVEELSR